MAAKDKTVQIRITAEMKSVLDAFDSAGKSINQFGTQTEKIGKSIDGVFSPLMKGLTAAVAAIGAGMGALTKTALSVGGDFELTMARVKGVTASTQEEFEQLTQKARDLGEKLPISASQAAEAMYSLSSAGMTARETLESIEAVTGLSIAQNYDLAASANIMTATLRGFGLEADQSTRVVDVFNNAISSSMLTMEKLNDAMVYVAPVARSLNMSLEDTAAAMGRLADSGLRGEQIGTALRSIMLGLVDPTAEAAKELSRLGVTVTDVNGKLRPLDQIFQDLKGAGMSAAEAIKIFDRRSVAAALTLADTASGLRDYSNELGRIGRTQELLAEQMGTFANRAKAVKSAIEETLLVTFDQIADQAKQFADELRDMVLVFNSWARETHLFERVLEGLIQGFGLATGNAGQFKDMLDSIDIDIVVAQFKGFAAGAKSMFEALSDLAGKVPWRFLAENLDTIAYTIATGWAVGKLTAIGAAVIKLSGTIVSLAKAVAALAAAQTAAGGGVLLSGAGALSLSAFGAGAAGALALIAAFPSELSKSTADTQLWTDAINGNLEALAQLTKEEQEYIRRGYGVGVKMEEESEKAERAMETLDEASRGILNAIVNTYKTEVEQVSHLVGAFGAEIKQALADGGEGGVREFLARFGQLPPEMERIMGQVVAAVSEKTEELAELGGKTNTFSENVAAGIQSALADYQKYANDMVAQTEELVAATGINATEAWALLEAELKAKAASTSQGLVKEFENPAVAAAFAQAFEVMAQGAGDAMTLRISDALNNVKSAINAISREARTAIDTFLMDLAAKAPGYQNLQLQQVRETVDSIVFMADNGMTQVVRVYDKATGEIADVASAMQGAGQDSSAAFDQAANRIGVAGQQSGEAWKTGALQPLQQTAQSADVVNTSITGIIQTAQGAAASIAAMAEEITGVFAAMGTNMVSTITSALDSVSTLFGNIGLNMGQEMTNNLDTVVRNAIPALSRTAMDAGQSMGQAMGQALESTMQRSIQNINLAIGALERRVAAAQASARSAAPAGGIDAVTIESVYQREG